MSDKKKLPTNPEDWLSVDQYVLGQEVRKAQDKLNYELRLLDDMKVTILRGHFDNLQDAEAHSCAIARLEELLANAHEANFSAIPRVVNAAFDELAQRRAAEQVKRDRINKVIEDFKSKITPYARYIEGPSIEGQYVVWTSVFSKDNAGDGVEAIIAVHEALSLLAGADLLNGSFYQPNVTSSTTFVVKLRGNLKNCTIQDLNL